MGWLDRVRSPAARAVRGAGPPMWQVVTAIVGGSAAGVVLIVLWPSLPFAAIVVPPALLSLAVSLRDRDGPMIRGALAYVALEQRRRSGGRRMPATRRQANAWLAVEHPDASAIERAAVLIGAKRFREALELIDANATAPMTELDAVRVARLRASAKAALESGSRIDLDAIRALAVGLPGEERRYQVLSAAWTQAFLDISNRRPWRAEFLASAREHAPYALPARVRLAMALQQYAGPIACLLAGVIVGGGRAFL